MTHYLRYAARSDRGLVRRNNQDSVYAGSRLLAVADGMGGHVGGEVASRIVIASLEYLDEDDPGGDMLEALREAVDVGTDHLREMVEERPDLDGMGTTLTALLFNGRRIGLCHVGDSRAYLFRNDVLTQITHDDTFVQALIDEGRITVEEASVHPQRSVILRALNGMEVDPDLSMREGRSGDRYLLCSDGLSSYVSHERIEKVLRTATDPAEAADQLIDFALRAGGPDNVTVIVADLVDDDDSDTVSDMPVVDGAAGNNAGQRAVRGTTPAERAALLTRTDDDDADDSDEAPADTEPTNRRRTWIAAVLGVLLLLVAAVVAGRLYVNSQYFVRADGDDVVIYNGVDTDIGPISLYSVAEQTDYKFSDLQPAARIDISEGVSVGSIEEARDVVGRLEEHLLPYCDEIGVPDPGGDTTGDPNATPTTSPGEPSADATATGSTEPPATDAPTTSDPTGTSAPDETAASATSSAPASPPADVECRPRR